MYGRLQCSMHFYSKSDEPELARTELQIWSRTSNRITHITSLLQVVNGKTVSCV